jgi:inner membrane protein
MPEDLKINGKIVPEIRYRGIYQSVVYESDLQLTGEFVLPGTASIKNYEILWSEAYYSVGVSDNRGLKGIENSVMDEPSIHIQKIGAQGKCGIKK